MPILLYRRHGSGCPTKDPASPQYKLSHKLKRMYMDCDCPLWLGGRYMGKEVERQSTGTRDLAEAKRIVAGISPDSAPSRGIALEDCITKFMESRKSEHGRSTVQGYEVFFERFKSYAASRGVVYARDITPEFCEQFKIDGLPKSAESTRATWVQRLRAFLRECERIGWIEARVVDRVRTHNFEYEQALPFEEDEIAKILSGAAGWLKLVIDLMLETGMRVSDAVQFNPAKLVRGSTLWIYPFKMEKRKRVARQRDKRHEVFLSDDLKTRIETNRDSWRSPRLPFKTVETVIHNTSTVRVAMQKLGERIGVEDCRPHRLRDTFAVRKLVAGVSIDDVSRLLGHSSVTITEQAYAAWVPARARRLEGVVAQSLGVLPNGHINGDAK